MQYTRYYEKISTVARIWGVIRRFRVLILSIIGVCLALTSGYLGAQGCVYDEVACPDTVLYGDTLPYSAAAVFRDVRYEYSEDSEFSSVSEIAPRYPGKYYVRAVSTSSFGKARYGNTYAYTILPKTVDVWVEASQIPYGDHPTVTADLPYGDSVSCNAFTYDDPTRAQTGVTPVATEIVILSAQGDDVTDAYILNPIRSEIEFIPREITVTVSDAENIYNGFPFSFDGYELSAGTMAVHEDGSADRLIATFRDSITDVGSAPNTPEIKVIGFDNLDVTANYKITLVSGQLTVLKYPVQIHVQDASLEYSGAEQTFREFLVSENTALVEGHIASVAGSTRITDVGTATNILLFDIHDGNGRNVTENYSIFVSESLITVQKRPITVTTSSYEGVYDGTAQGSNAFTVTSDKQIADGETAFVSADTKITGVAESGTDNQLQISVKAADGRDVTGNYDISYVYGTLTMKPKTIRYSTEDKTLVYNGTAQTHPGFAISPMTTLTPGHVAYAKRATSVTNVSDGTVDNRLTLAVQNAAGEDQSVNYVFELTKAGKICVSPRPITVTADSVAKVYDGTALYGSTVTIDNLADGQTLSAELIGSQIEVGNSAVSVDGDSITVTKGEASVDLDNYIITLADGTLTVEKRPVTVLSDDGLWTYDGTAHSQDGHAVSDETPLVEGHRTEVLTLTEITNVGDGPADNEITVDILNSDGESVSGNYEITYVCGELVINPKPVTVITQGHEFIYNGEARSWDGHTVSDETPLVEGHRTEVLTLTEITNVWDGPADNEITVDILDSDGEVMSGNYEITYVCGELVITPLSVTVITESHEFTYNGASQSWSGHAVSDATPLVEGHRTEVLTLTEITNVWDGPADNALTVDILDSADARMTENYEITYEYGELVINSKTITVISESHEFTYNGEAQSWNGHTAVGLVDGHRTEVLTLTEITNVWDGPADNEITVDILDSDGEIMSGNYDITYEYGELVVNPKPITVISESREFTYNGEAQSWNGHTAVGLVDGHRTEVLTLTEITNVWDGPADNEITVDILDSDGEIMSGNYDITYEYGELVINPKPITVITEGREWTYDGTPRSWNGHTAVGLVDGHRTVVLTLTEITNVWDGPADNALTVDILDSADARMTENYEITYECGKLIIKPKPVTVITKSHEFTYNGEAQSWNGHAVSDATPLVTGHRTEVLTLTEITNVWDGPADNVLTVDILDSADARMTENYEITYEYGELVVNPKPITVISEGHEFIYNGEAQYWEGHEFVEDGALVAGHTVEVIEKSTVTNVADSGRINVLRFKIWCGTVEQTANYEITYRDEGILTVLPRPLVVQTGSGRWEYDGEAHYSLTVIAIGEYAPVLDHRLVAQEPYTYITEVAESPRTNVLTAIVVDGSGRSCMDNYEIREYEYGVLEIYRRKITVAAQSATKEYDGTPLTCNEYFVYRADGAPALVLDHRIDPATLLITGSVTEVMPERTPNVVTGPATILTGNGRDVTNNYEITYENGELWITPRQIIITAGSAQKVYDATPLTCEEYTVTRLNPDEIALVLNHAIRPGSVVTEGSITDVGRVPNTIRNAADDPARIYDPDTNRDVSHNYAVTYAEGVLEVLARKIFILSGTDSKFYDGTPLTCPDYDVRGEGEMAALVGDHRIDDSAFSITGSITDPGATPNTMGGEIQIFSGSLSVTHNYEIIYEEGTLTVFEPPEDSYGGDLDNSGDIGGGERDPNGGRVIAMEVWSATSGPVYLRYMSFGNYTGRGWTAAPVYGEELDDLYAYTYLTGVTMQNNGYSPTTMRVHLYTTQMFLPYYMAMGDFDYVIQGNDVVYSGDTAEFQLDYYGYTGYGDDLVPNPDPYTEEELEYRAFVRANYLDLYDDDTRRFMEGIIAENNFSPEDSQIIKKVARYIQGSATYNMDYDPALDAEENIAIAFLETYKEGICQHYALAATLLYRALGIPARWTVGYTGTTTANEWVEITTARAHAWVEVYIDGIGWICVEVTGGGNFDEEEETTEEETTEDETTEDETTEDETLENGGDINDSGNIGGGERGEGDNLPVALRLWSSVSGPVYLRYKSFGNFTGQSWTAAPVYTQRLDTLYAYNYLTGIAMKNAGFTPATMRVQLYTSQLFLPYYMAMGDFGYNIQGNDVTYSGEMLEFWLEYYSYAGYGTELAGYLGEYTQAELDYREFVHANYLDLYDSATAAYMNCIIEENEFNPNDPLIIQKVAAYIQNAATYNLNYDPALDAEENIAIAFLETYKEGICQHYALSATLLYRALGIPARWTIGYVAHSTADEWVDVTADLAHAWTEVYIDGVGWICVEVTGSGLNDGSGGGGGDAPKQTLEIRPVDVVEEYNGEPHYAIPELYVEFDSLLEELLMAGYTYEVEVYGSLTEIGESYSGIKNFVLKDARGNDVTDQFNVIFLPGLIRVTKQQVVINLFELQKFYDGTELRYEPNNFWISKPFDVEVLLDLSACSITKAGVLDEEELRNLPITILNSDGEDVTDQYYIKFVGAPLRIDKRVITLQAASETKTYDGTPLTNDSVSIIVGELVDGHRLVAQAVGSITLEGTTKNVVDTDTLRILDENGNNVTDCYEIICNDGELTVIA